MINASVFLTLAVLIFIYSHKRGLAGLFLPSSLFLFGDLLLQMIFPIIFSDVSNDGVQSAVSLSAFGYVFFFIIYLTLSIANSQRVLLKKKSIQSTLKDEKAILMCNISTFVTYAGVILILIVFAIEGVIPALTSEPNESRFFYGSPLYFSILKYPYWAGIELIVFGLLMSYVFEPSKKWKLSFGFILPYKTLNRDENDFRVRLSQRIEKYFQY